MFTASPVEALARARFDIESHEGFTRVDTDACTEPLVTGLGQLADAVEQTQGRTDSALGIVLVRYGDAEDTDHGVSDELLDHASVLLDHLAREACE